MLRVFIDSTDVSYPYVQEGSVAIEEAIDRQSGTASFILENLEPRDGAAVVIWDCTSLTGAVIGNIVPVADDGSAVSKFRVGDVVSLDIGTAIEDEATITYVGSNAITITPVAHSHYANALFGKKVFGGVVTAHTTTETSNNTSHVSYSVACSGYRYVLDGKIINNVWTSAAPHEIVNDILATVNYSVQVDALDYASNVAIQAKWMKLNDASDATISNTAPRVGTSNGVLAWTFSAGTANWLASALASKDVSPYVGASSGAPVRGEVSLWIKCADVSKVTAVEIGVGSDSSNYAYYPIIASDLSTSWKQHRIPLTAFAITGTPDWTAVVYANVRVTETASSSISVDDLRVQGRFSISATNVDTTGDDIAHFAVSFKSASEAIDRLAKHVGWSWHIDEAADLHFSPVALVTPTAPFSLSDTTENHIGFSASVDMSQLANRVYVRGGKEASGAQTEEQYGDGLKTTFFLRESPRSIGPYLYDIVVSVDTGAGYVTQTCGIANRDDPAAYAFLLNAQEGYLTNGTHAVLGATHKLKAVYTYLKPVLIRQDNLASQAAMQSILSGTDGVYEHVIIDSTITSSAVARLYADSHLASYANALLTVSFTTFDEGLRAGQTLTVNKPSHGINDTFLIQRVSRTQVADSTWQFSVTCASTVLGIVELFKLLLDRDLNTDESTTVDVLKTATEAVSVADTSSTYRTSTKYRWATASPTSEGAKWSLFSWA